MCGGRHRRNAWRREVADLPPPSSCCRNPEIQISRFSEPFLLMCKSVGLPEIARFASGTSPKPRPRPARLAPIIRISFVAERHLKQSTATSKNESLVGCTPHRPLSQGSRISGLPNFFQRESHIFRDTRNRPIREQIAPETSAPVGQPESQNLGSRIRASHLAEWPEARPENVAP